MRARALTLLAAPALAALVLAIPLIALHLRRRKPPRRAVGSLLAWRDLPGVGGGGARRFGRPPLPLLLAAAAARPRPPRLRPRPPGEGEERRPAPPTSTSSTSRCGWGPKTKAARGSKPRAPNCANGSPDCRADEAVRIVGAGADPDRPLRRRRRAARARRSKGSSAGPGPANLPAALRLAAGLRAGNDDEVVPAAGARGSGAEGDAAAAPPTKTVTVGEPVERRRRSAAPAPTATCSAPKPAKSSSG